jgi:hypothetical protein
VDLDHIIGIDRGLNIDGPKPVLQKWGFIIEEKKRTPDR